MSPDLLFVVATPAQHDEVALLIRTAFTHYVRALGRELPPEPPAWYAEAIAQGDIFIAFEGAEMVGAIATKRGEGEMILEFIAVSPARQKQGIASWMIRQIEPIALARGRPLLSLNTAEMMNDRVRLYERHGFVIVRRGPPDHGMDDHLRVYMEKRLTDGGGSAARDRA